MNKLSRACRDRDVESVQQLLLNPSVDPSANGNEAIKEAVYNGSTLVVQLLLDAGVDLREDYWSTLSIAVREGHMQITRLMLQHDYAYAGTDKDVLDIDLVVDAICEKHTGIVHMLLQDRRLSLSVYHSYLLRQAVMGGCVDTVQVLLQDERLDPTFNGNWALLSASMYGHTDMVRLLLQDDRVQLGVHDMYAGQKAVEYGHTDIVALLQYHACEAMVAVV